MLLVRLLAAVVALPWIVLVGAVRVVVAVIAWPWRLRARAAAVIVCPAGHANAVMGRWTCSCGAVFLGHVFGPCPICGMPAGWARCETCGLAIASPWKVEH